MDWETRTRLYDLCNPEKALGPDDARYVDVDAFGGPEPGPRGAPWAGGLVARIEPADRPVMERVTASPGAGLTMELRRIAARLTEKNGAHLLPVWIDAPDVLSPSAPIDVPDVLIAAAVESAVAQAAGAPVQDPLARLGRWIAPEGGDGRADVLGELRHGGVVRDAVRRRIDPELSVFVREVRGELTRHHAEARRLGYGGSW